MAELRRADAGGGLYERLLQRLALALDEADTAVRLRDEVPRELELRGLSPAEVELIQAYMAHDLRWLSGWHAAAEELALLERKPLRPPRPASNGSRPTIRVPGRAKPLLKRRQGLCCALCGTPADWQPGQGIRGCLACGSQLFRASKPR
ncbi:hypothetical protein D3880_19470 [Pseudomonas cavernae]|uniref:Uncharacterized protein n=1 Tax=Pseudomonas cavernae TaxID=2320867 RepID=A0A385Z8N2_9PSED|nr:hypothetical protein [Pseudomonas cavernae]AYC34413.1 hypothetical protein D3880_19470 [Pseudomonas cavernae]